MTDKTQKILTYSIIGVTIVGLTLFFFRKKIFGKSAKLKYFKPTDKWYQVSKNKDIADKLHPEYRDELKDFLSWMEKETDYYPILTSGYRTYEKQAYLKRQNSKNARAGYSNHNYGFAVDLNIKNRKTGKQLRKASSVEEWNKTGIPQEAKKRGLTWGGDFRNYHDPVHFAKGGMPKTSELYARWKDGKRDSNGYVKV